MEWGDTENRFYIRIWEIKRDLKKEGWVEKPLGTTQGSFIVNEGIDGKISKTIGKEKMDDTLISTLTDFGGTLASLGFAGWLIVHLLKLQTQERERWLAKDDASDTHLRELIGETNKVLSDMRVAKTEFREVIITQRK